MKPTNAFDISEKSKSNKFNVRFPMRMWNGKNLSADYIVDKSTYLADGAGCPSEVRPRLYFPGDFRVDLYTHPLQRSNPRTTAHLSSLAWYPPITCGNLKQI